MKNILIAPNAFKHSLSAQEVAIHIEEGLKKSLLKCKTTLFPIGDGGDGTCFLIHEKLNGTLKEVEVYDPLGKKIKANYSLIHDGRTAVIEMADASGIKLLRKDELLPLEASSLGTGELILDALDQNVEEIVIGMGGSATVEGGCGILHALGVRFLDKDKNNLWPYPYELAQMDSIDDSGIDPRLAHCRIKILCDVDNPLLGREGAASVFGPQKGASRNDVVFLDRFLTKFSEISKKTTGKDTSSLVSGGTAGGAAAGMYAFAGAELVNGIDYFLKTTRFDEELEKADVLITGEGSLDEQTLSGKGPYGVAIRAKKQNVKTIALAGKVPIWSSEELRDLFPLLVPINHQALSLSEALSLTGENLERTATLIGNFLADD